MKVLVIIPAYNEELSIQHVIHEIQSYMPEVDILVINDGSTDHTAAVAKEAGAIVLSMPFNVGIGGGMQTGYMYARDHNYDVAVQMDADGQHAAADLQSLLSEIQENDMVIGSRFLEKTSYRSSFMRKLGIRFFSMLVSLVTRQRFTDTTSGFRAAGRRVIELYANYYPIDYPEVESIVYLTRKKCRLVEVKAEMRQRETGKSSITPIKSAYYMVKVTLSVLISAVRFNEVKPTS
ncbi:glycosyltransferase family 2 protein [Paenibacillus sp. KQZ6P-2]|uniref:Glycosyltransferase family 2 protein n=1 Tax=Paenibacillus mangrovi TaxID=2931978 RepID=A0A9X1WYF2_9BACL|nr:glycosyltransferase family 2 protein [Paenibacillus mangrovi]MCJ8014419.1 glycosyltransferase family 2 protein [Paenibacillus mangrovi]